MSGSTFLSLGISISDDLSSTIKTFIHNKHDFFISLSHNALTKLYEDATRKKVKEYFYNRSDDNSIIKLDQNISLYFVKIFDKSGIALKDHSRNIQISFLAAAASQLMNLKFAVNCYLKDLELARSDVVSAITKVKIIFDNYFYVSEDQVVRKILKTSVHFDVNNIIELELITICHRRFLAAIEKEKKDLLIEVEDS